MSKKNEMKVNVSQTNNLPEVEVIDATQTKGKISGKFTLVDDAVATDAIERVDKNKLFAEVSDYFCPIKYDWREDVAFSAVVPCIDSGMMDIEVIQPSIDAAKKKFLEAHSEEIEFASKLSFAEVLAKLQENKTLYNKVLAACKIAELNESNYIENGKVAIFRANQCTDKDGNNRYTDVTLKATENGIEFTANLFVEYREITTNNILLAIRYYSSKQEAQRKLSNQLADYRRILTNAETAIAKAKENGFSKSQVLSLVEKIYG